MKIEKENSTWWKSVYNLLFLLTISKDEYNEYKKLSFPLVDTIEEELEESFDVGLCEDAKEYYLSQKWVESSTLEQLTKLKIYVEGISSDFWNETDIMSHSEWSIARQWAKDIFEKMKFERRGFDYSDVTVIYTKDK